VSHALARRVGLYLFFGVDTLLFGALVSAYVVLRLGAGVWPPAGAPLLSPAYAWAGLVILVAGGVALWVFGEVSARRRMLLLLGMVLLFLSSQSLAWRQWQLQGMSWRVGGIFGGIVLGMVGLHAMHVLALVPLTVLALWRRLPSAETAHALTLDYYYLLAVWAVLFALLWMI
jgi:heme/copper-type cytochrome/quinol oxidase subunit 3